MSDDNVTPLSSRLGRRPPVTVLPRPWDGCQHRATDIDTTLRTVSCHDCGAMLDPVEVLIGFALDWSRWEREAEALAKLRAGHEADERARWERARDRHLRANPGHVLDPFRTTWSRTDGHCRICKSLEHGCPQSVKALLCSGGMPG